MGSPRLVDAAVIQAEMARKVGRIGRLFPILQRLIGRASSGDAGSFSGSSLELAAPWALYLGDLLEPRLSTPLAARFGDPLASSGVAQSAVAASLPSSTAADSPQYLVRVSRARPSIGVPAGPRDSVGNIAERPALPRAATREISALAATPATAFRVIPAHGREESVAVSALPGRSPAPRRATLSSLDRNADRGSGSDAASVAAMPSVRELRVPRAGREIEARVALSPSGSAFPSGTGANLAPLARTSVVPELPAGAPPGAPMVLPISFGETPRFAAPSFSRTPPVPSAPVGPKPAAMVAPRLTPPPVAAIAGAELDRLAEKVTRVIARRVAVERERRGR